jgi:hypothetical protein
VKREDLKMRVGGHPENKDVMLRIMTLATGKITVLAKLFGGDGKRLAFVSYQLVP